MSTAPGYALPLTESPPAGRLRDPNARENEYVYAPGAPAQEMEPSVPARRAGSAKGHG